MNAFKNPLAHIAATPAAQLTIIAGRQQVRFRPIGLSTLTALAERFPAIKAKMEGGTEDIVMTQAEEIDMASALIAMAIAPDGVTPVQLAAMEASARSMKPMERDIAVGMIYRESMPDTTDEAPNFRKPANRRTRRATAATTTTTTTKKKPKPA